MVIPVVKKILAKNLTNLQIERRVNRKKIEECSFKKHYVIGKLRIR